MRAVSVAHVPLKLGVYAAEDFLVALGLGAHVPFFSERPSLSFKRPVDVIILGPNSPRIHLYDTSSLGLLFGEDYSWEKSAEAPRLQKFMGDHPSCVVLLLPASGGAYRRGLQTKLLHEFPAVTWLMPIVHDYHGNPLARVLIEDLAVAGILNT